MGAYRKMPVAGSVRRKRRGSTAPALEPGLWQPNTWARWLETSASRRETRRFGPAGPEIARFCERLLARGLFFHHTARRRPVRERDGC